MLTKILICILPAGLAVGNIISALKNKSLLRFFAALCFAAFAAFWIVSFLLGGSAFNDAENSFELYQHGHYYLVEHGIFTEVSQGQYRLAMISEIVGLPAFALGFILSIIAKSREK